MGNFKRENKFGGKRGGGFSDRKSGRGDRFSDRRGGRDSERPSMHSAICSQCGRGCEVPFRPTGDKPVYCSDCFKNKGGSESRGFDRNREESRGFGRRDFKRSDSDDKKMYEAVCSKCGDECEVPFKPSPDKLVYCDQCFSKTDKRESSSQDNKQLEAINSKLDKILKMLTPAVAVEVKEIVKPKVKMKVVEEVKAVEEVKEEKKEEKKAKKEKKEKKVAPVKKEKAKKKK